MLLRVELAVVVGWFSDWRMTGCMPVDAGSSIERFSSASNSYLFDVTAAYVRVSFGSEVSVPRGDADTWLFSFVDVALVSCMCSRIDCSDEQTLVLIWSSWCKMSLIESAADDAMFFKILSSDDSFEFRLAICLTSFCMGFAEVRKLLIF